MSEVRIYPVPEGELLSADFQMQVNGEHVPLHCTRVSAYPINRRWPGHQRPLNQTELASFASFAMNGPVHVRLKPERPFQNVAVRPISRNIQPQVSGGVIEFTLPECGQYTVELDGFHHALHIFADSPGIYPVDRTDPKVRYFGPGLHDAGEITLHEGETLFLDEGAIVFGNVIAENAANIRILGHGILDGSRNKEIYLHEFNDEDRRLLEKGFAVMNAQRKDTIRLIRCDNLLIDGITIRDSLLYNIRPICCNNMQIRNVKLIGNWRYNSDGIDIHNCCDVHISNCFIRTFDDCICIKGFDRHLPPEMMKTGAVRDRNCRITVEKCVLWCDWNTTLEIGAETRAEEIAYITFRDCDIIHNYSAACDITSVDYADIHDVLYEDIRVEENAPQPRILQTGDDQDFTEIPDPPVYGCVLRCVVQRHPEYSGSDPRVSICRNITYRNISVTGRMLGCYFIGADAEHVSGPFRIENLRCNGKHLTTPEELRLHIDPFISGIEII